MIQDVEAIHAYEWAKKQNYQSIAARCARALAGEIDILTADRDAWKQRAEKAETLLDQIDPPKHPCIQCPFDPADCGPNGCEKTRRFDAAKAARKGAQ